MLAKDATDAFRGGSRKYKVCVEFAVGPCNERNGKLWTSTRVQATSARAQRQLLLVLLPRSVVSSTHGPHGRGPLVGTGASPKFSCGYHGWCSFMQSASMWSLLLARSTSVRRQVLATKTQRVTGRPFAPGCGLLYSSIVVVGTHEQQPRECLPVQVES